MENLTEYKIKLPTLPDGFELVGHGIANDGDIRLLIQKSGSRWFSCTSGCAYFYLARRRESLADWANKQRLFQALAEMRGNVYCSLAHLNHDQWEFDFVGASYARPILCMGQPPTNLTGKLRLEAGKWVDA